MINKLVRYKSINPYLVFLFFVFIYPFIYYFTNSGKLTFLPLIASGCYVIVHEILNFRYQEKKQIIEALLFAPFTILSLIAYYGHPFLSKPLNYITFSLFFIPLIALTVGRLYTCNESQLQKNIKFISKIIILFSIGQLLICIGQLSTYTFGYGLPIIEEYRDRSFISGTFYNPNNMSASILILSFILLGLKNFLSVTELRLSLIIFSLVLLFGGSRSAIFLYIIIILISLKPQPKQLVKYAFYFFLSILFIYFLSIFLENPAIDRVLNRLYSFINIINKGLLSDGSISARSSSYIHFLKQLPDIGMGTHKLYDYHDYSGSASLHEKELLFSYPHSFIVEIGYWLGWAGLLLFFIPLGLLLKYSKRKIQVILLLAIATSIPSTIIGNTFFIFICFLSLMDFGSVNSSRHEN